MFPIQVIKYPPPNNIINGIETKVPKTFDPSKLSPAPITAPKIIISSQSPNAKNTQSFNQYLKDLTHESKYGSLSFKTSSPLNSMSINKLLNSFLEFSVK